jgi:hypothetical protein
MKITQQSFELRTPDHVINLRPDLGEFKAVISRLNEPFFSIEYDHISKSGIPLDDYLGTDKEELFKKAVGYGIYNLSFEDSEIAAFKSMPDLQKQFDQFRKSLPKEKLKGWKFIKFLNRKPFMLK